MENELMELKLEQIIVQQGNIIFTNFENLKSQAAELASHIANVEVTDENIKESKKMLAAVNKVVKELEGRRIKIKNLMLEPYQAFEEDVKEIVGIVKEADEIVRNQVRSFEEDQRDQKYKKLHDIFMKRIVHYSFRDLFSLNDFIHPSHLNKSMSIEAVENEMVEFLEKISRDLKAIEVMPDAEAVLSHYTEVKDVAAAITLHSQQEARKRQIEASKAIKKNEERIAYLVTASITEEKELALVKLFFDQHQIKYGVDYITVGGM
ncbi:DUF1351 domain-containing protein [Bacillus sp. ISL-75]|uniref:DUF1351 domain-containing protein n=1 Tax=Bacillus sp. ISL-75 TaxID=2819137 RepID=UPI0020362929|nr:DUF1351 domain-containing protein [Bacillus sp. ISL-75]